MVKQTLRHIFLLVALFMAAASAWAISDARVIVYSEPSVGGWVFVGDNAPSSYTLTDDYEDKSGGFWTTNKELTFYRHYKCQNNYIFKGWTTDKNSNEGDMNSSVTVVGKTSRQDYTYYAIFATLQHVSSTPIQDTRVGEYTSSTITLKHAHAGNVKLSISGDHPSDFSVGSTNFSSTALGEKTITITFAPKSAGQRKATLTITSDNGLEPISIQLVGNATQIYTVYAQAKTTADLITATVYEPDDVFYVYYPKNGENIQINYPDYQIEALTPAIANYIDGKIQTNFNTGNAKFHITRKNSDQYNALDETLTLTIATSGEICKLQISPTYVETGTGDNSTSGTVTLNGKGEILSFNYKLNNNANVKHYLTTQYSTTDTGDNFQDIPESQVGEDDITILSHSLTLPEGTKRIRFKRTDNGLGDKRFIISDITVTRKQYIETSVANGETLILPTVAINNQTSTTFNLKWSACSDIKITCDNPKFTIGTPEITSADGTQTITVSCNTSEVGTHTGYITIYNQEQKTQFPVKCEVKNKWNTDIISGSTSHSMAVDGTWKTDFVFPSGQTATTYPTETGAFHYSIEHSFADDDLSLRNPAQTDKVITYNNGTITAHNAGTAVITIKHNETDNHFESTEFKCTITVSKHDVERAWKDPVYFNDTIAQYFTTTNDVSPIVIASQTDTEVAKLTPEFNPTSKNSLDLITFNKKGSSTVTVSQTATYYWNSYSQEHTITPINPNNHVPFTLTQDNYINTFQHTFLDPAADAKDPMGPDWSDNGIDFGGGGILDDDEGWNWDEKYIILEFTGIPDSLFFSASRADAASGTIKLSVSQGKNANSLTELWVQTGTNYENVGLKLNPETRFIKLSYTGNLWGRFKDINVTELNEFYAVETSNVDNQIEHLYFNEDDKPNQIHAEVKRTFDIKYANAGYKVNAVSNDPHFTVTPAATNEIGGEDYGTKTFTVAYKADETYATTGNNSYITVTDELGHKDIVYLHASSDRFNQTLRWRDDIAAVGEDKPYTVRMKVGEITNAAIASSDLTITYNSSNKDKEVIRVDGNKLILVAPGETTITATQDGSDLFYPATPISKQFIVTDKLLQYVIWTDTPNDIIKTDGTQTIELNAQVYVQTEDESNPFVLSPERTQELTYSSANSNIVSVEGNILTVRNIGTTTLTAQVPGTDDYAEASLTVPVTVRYETAGCEDILLYGPTTEPIQFFQYNLNEIVKDPIALDRSKGIPGHIEIDHYGNSWNLGVQYYAAEIRVEESTDGQNWTNKKTITPIKDQINKDIINLSRNATHIRFVRNAGGQGYQFLQDIKVYPAQYIETYTPGLTTPIEEIDFGEIHVGSRVEKTFDVQYSNIKSTLSPVPSHSDIQASPNTFGSCGAFGTQTITITWTPSTVNDNAEESITLWDQNSGMEKTIKLKAKIIKGPQNTNWSEWGGEAPNTISHCNLIAFPEKTTADRPIKWEVTAGKEFADFIEGTLILQLIDNGTITVKATSAETNNYLAFEQIFTFKIEAQPIFLGTTDSNWDNVENWNFKRLPCEEETVILQVPTTLSSDATIAGLTFSENGSLHITSTGGLSVGEQGIQGAATNGSSIIIDNLKTGAGFLRISPDCHETMPHFTMRYETASTLDSGANKDATWQYIGAPGANCQFTVDYITWLYHWSEAQGWINKTGTLTLDPFAGYAITQYGKPTYELVSTVINQDKTITLTKTTGDTSMNGDNLFANSYSAPIDAKNFTPEDFEGEIEKTFYLFNSGSWNEWNNQNNQNSTIGSNNSNTPGQYRAIPALAASYIDKDFDQTTISPMQGVYMIAKSEEASIKLNYDKHVWNAGCTGGTNMHEPMRAPSHNAFKPDNFRRLRIQVNSANSGADRMYIIQDTITTTDYDTGYDAPNQLAEGLANIYTNEHFGQMEVSCSNHIDSTFVGFTAGSDSIYTLRFNAIIGDDLHLYDLDNDSLILLEEDATYTFHATPHSKNDLRFQILLHPEKNLDFVEEEKDEIYTGITDVHTTQVWSHGNCIYISNAPTNTIATLYNISGHKLLTTPIHHTPYTLDLSYLPKGVYMLQLNTQVYKFVIQ